ncbi:MAG: arsenite methyltransferase [Planctomycetota bacterium]|jgi:SAM-dependent methyltransferase
MNKDPRIIREEVSVSYTSAVQADRVQQDSSCCCAGSCSTEVEQKGVAAKLGGYASEELSELPDDAVSNSFGCGNPLAFADVAEGETVVDLGSGAGIDVLLAGRKVGPSGHVIGIDMTDEMLARARANIEAAGMDHVEVRKGIIEELPIDDASVDWVISNCVINLSPEKERVFAEIARVLKPGGRLVVSDIVAEDLPEWVREDAALYGGCLGGAISEGAYLAGLRSAGMVDAEVTERIVYDEAQLAAFVGSECCDPSAAPKIPTERVAELSSTMTGKVWSAKFSATRA